MTDITYKRKRHYQQWIDFKQEEPEEDGVVVLYMPDVYKEKYFMMNLSNDHHSGWYDKHKKVAKAWFRVPKFSEVGDGSTESEGS